MNYERVPALVEDFAGSTGETQPVERSGVHTILFTDMESSTALTQSFGDAKAQELVRAHNIIVRGPPPLGGLRGPGAGAGSAVATPDPSLLS